MKRMKFQDGKVLPYVFFDKNEHHEIERLLADSPPEKVFFFIQRTLFVLNRILITFPDGTGLHYEQPSKGDHREAAKEVANQCKKTRALLERVLELKLLPRRRFSMADLGPETAQELNEYGDPVFEHNREIYQTAERAMADLEKIESAFNEAALPSKHGSPGTINEELTAAMIEAYRKYIGEPGASINEAFPHLLKIVFDAAGIPLKHPQHLARKVLKKMPTI